MRATLPQHPFEPAKRADPNGGLRLDGDPRCGHLHLTHGDLGLFCGFTAEHPVHNGNDIQVRVRAVEAENR